MKQKIEAFIKEIGLDNLKQAISEIEGKQPTITKEQQIEEFFLSVINGLTIQIKKQHPNSVFYKKGDSVFIEQDFKYKNIYCRYTDFWSVFESEYGLKYEQIQATIKSQLEKHLKMEGFTPRI